VGCSLPRLTHYRR